MSVLSTSPFLEDVFIRRGAAHYLGRIELRDADDQPVDLTGSTVALKFRPSRESTIEFDMSGQVERLTEAGQVQVYLRPDDTVNLPTFGVWDLAIDDLVVWEGTFRAHERTSR